MKKYITSFLTAALLTLAACGGGDDQPLPPEAPRLIFPENNSECLEGIADQNNPELSNIVFRWQPADHAVSYSVSIKNLITGRTVTEASNDASLGIALLRGTPYSWSVTATGAPGTATALSETWKFYNAGEGIISYTPFPADLVYPTSGVSLNLNGTNSLEFRWEGADADNDITGYEVFLDTKNPPAISVGSNGNVPRLTVTGLSPGATYYWRVVTYDRAGNNSISEVSQFLVSN